MEDIQKWLPANLRWWTITKVVAADSKEYWGHKYSEPNEMHRNSFIIFEMEKITGEKKFLVLFSGATYANSDVVVVAISSSPKDFLTGWSANDSIGEYFKGDMTGEEKDLASKIESYLSSGGYEDSFSFSDLSDWAESFMVDKLGHIFFDINKKREDITELDLESAKDLVAKIEGILKERE